MGEAFERVVVLGTGAWGTALALVAARPGRAVALWSRDRDRAAALASRREQGGGRPGTSLPPAITITADARCVLDADLLLAAVPAQDLRAVLSRLPRFRVSVPVLICAKGLETGSRLRLSEVLRSVLPGHIPAVLSGPSFAADVGRGRPTAVTLAAPDLDLARIIAQAMERPAFRLYHTDDLAGVEIGGAAKNVLAIACGMAAGMDLGASAQAALIARGFAELARFGEAAGARPETLMGLSGLGDLVLTCSSPRSRNFAFGHALGRGAAADLTPGGALVEGVATAQVLSDLARAQAVEMPIVDSVAAVLAGSLTPSAAVDRLLARPPRAERGSTLPAGAGLL